LRDKAFGCTDDFTAKNLITMQDPYYPTGCCLLAALGANNLSIQPDAVHHVLHAFSNVSVAALRDTLPSLLDLDGADEVEQKIHSLF
jgi:hypothetical protein